MRKIVIFIFLSCLSGAASLGQSNQPDNSQAGFIKTILNHQVKKFAFTDLAGIKWGSDNLKGKIVVINFWFTTCKPCILEIPHLNKLVEENKNNPVVFIAPAPENEAQIKKFLGKYPFNYHIISSSLDYITSMNVENFPTHLVIDKKGIIRQVCIGYADNIKEKLQAEIDTLIK
ncbi:MAG: TlpA family protein disulfide reductase [Bacteroidota bacterium]